VDYVELIGYIAGMITTASFAPQVMKTIKTKSTRDISFGMYTVLCIGIALWFAYGILIESLPIVLANGVTLALAITILAFKLKYK
jgi:MtN3 and saliva related transmembrane protein